ncbi:Inner membrane transport protein ydiN, partial [human gut metagenome]
MTWKEYCITHPERHFPLASDAAFLCIYFSYFLHGISVITLAQNMTSLAEKF